MSNKTDKNLFAKVDKAIFEQIKQIRNSSQFEKVSETMRSFSEKEQLIINQTLSLMTLVLPVIAILVMLVVRYNLGSDLAVRKDLEDKIVSIKENSVKLSSIERAVVPRKVISSKADLVNQINTISLSKKIDSKNIDIDNFSDSSQGGQIKKIEATAQFKKLTSVNFSDFILDLQRNLKATIKSIEVTKDKDNLLVGNISFIMFSKAN